MANAPSSTVRDPARSVPPKTRVYGVLGGIASGKSAVARILAGDSGVVLDADELVSKLYTREEFRRRVTKAFGLGVLAADGSIDRAALGRAVFADQAARALLESWTHPPVRAELRARLEAARSAGVPRVVLDVPLLLENDREHRLGAQCDALIFVDSPARLRDARAILSRGWMSGEVARREALQLPLAEKRARAQHVIVNDTDRAHLESAVADVLRILEPNES